MKIKTKKLHDKAELPVYATDGAAAFDLHAIVDNPRGRILLLPGEYMKVRTGLAFEIPEGHGMFLLSRSGHGFGHNVRLANCVGLIDSDYRGEVMVKLYHDPGEAPLEIRHGDRIAQAFILPIPKVEFEVAQALSATQRGEGGLGHTGA